MSFRGCLVGESSPNDHGPQAWCEPTWRRSVTLAGGRFAGQGFRYKTDARWQRAEALFTAALERGEAEREAFIAEACEGDAELRQVVESLLKAHTEASGFMHAPVFDDAMQVIAEDEEKHHSPERNREKEACFLRPNRCLMANICHCHKNKIFHNL